MAREEIEAGDSRGSIYVAPAFRAGLRAEAGEKVGVFVFWDVKVSRDPNDIKFDVGMVEMRSLRALRSEVVAAARTWCPLVRTPRVNWLSVKMYKLSMWGEEAMRGRAS